LKNFERFHKKKKFFFFFWEKRGKSGKSLIENEIAIFISFYNMSTNQSDIEKVNETESGSETVKETIEVNSKEYHEFCAWREKMKNKHQHEKRFHECPFHEFGPHHGHGFGHKFGRKFGHKFGHQFGCKPEHSNSDSSMNEEDCCKPHMGHFFHKFHHMKKHDKPFNQPFGCESGSESGFGCGFSPFHMGHQFSHRRGMQNHFKKSDPNCMKP
jgi:hypothetical protein